ncbi:MAG: hypothetical protein ACRBBU_15990 [Pseudooceanicola sp.]
MIRKWYFCVNERGFEAAMPQMKAATMSARANTDLKPHCLYSGSNPHHRNILIRLGAEVIDHKPSFENALRHGYGDAFDTFNGHWLRVDLPLIEEEDDFVLYTDTDVMFEAHPNPAAMPRQLAAAPEFDQNNTRYFSSGVMVLNTNRMRELHDPFVAAIRKRLTGQFRYPAHDQESFNRFFRASPLNKLRKRDFDRLDPVFNWKPYWGRSADAAIIHFHGPKPPNIRMFEKGSWAPHQEHYVNLWRQQPEAYEHYCSKWEAYDAEGQAVLESFL